MASSLENHCEIPEIKDETCVCPAQPSSFTISEKALEKLKSKKKSSNLAAREAILTEMEEKWLQYEKNMEDAHSKKWGYSKEHLDEMEERLLKVFDLLPPCPSEQGIVKCLKTERNKIQCQNVLTEYVECTEKFSQKITLRTGAVSHVKERPSTNLGKK